MDAARIVVHLGIKAVFDFRRADRCAATAKKTMGVLSSLGLVLSCRNAKVFIPSSSLTYH